MWKRVIAKAPTASTAPRSSGGVFGCREAILPPTISPTLFRALECNRFPHQQRHNNIHDRQVHRRYYHHHRDRLTGWPFIFDLGRASTTSSHNNPQQHQQFRTSSTISDISSKKKKRKPLPKKGQKQNKRHPRNRAASTASQKPQYIRSQQPVHEMAAGMGITLEECSKDLIESCTNVRTMELNKRQRLKPWIMALLIHRYDRGIRDTDELNRDSVYYDGGRSTPNEANNATTAIATNNIDLRNVLTPPPGEINNYIATHHRSKNDTGNSNKEEELSREKISEILRHEKLALLAKEARRVLIDREIPFQEMAAFKNEAGVRRMSKQDPSIFLSLFSRAFCISERTKKSSAKQRKRRTKGGETGTESPSVAVAAQPHKSFTHRRFHPPSLKTSSHKKKKLKEKRDREAKNKQAANNNKTRNGHRNAPLELQQKLRVMNKKNR